MAEKQKIPFCTHDDLISLPKADVEAIGIITYQADKINYKLISELAGFGDGGIIEDKNSFSYKKVSRKEINIKDLEIDFQMSNSTIKRHIKRLEKINIGCEHVPLIYVNNTGDDMIYEINHKTYDKYYTLIDKDTLRKLLIINGTALKLYLVIKYHYEFCKKQNKKCILDLKYLAKKIGLKDRGNIKDILDLMEGTFIKRKMAYTHKIDIKEGKAHNRINKYYEYEIIETFNSNMIPTVEYENNNDDDIPW